MKRLKKPISMCNRRLFVKATLKNALARRAAAQPTNNIQSYQKKRVLVLVLVLVEGGGEFFSFTRVLRANPVAKAGSLSPLN